MHRDWYSSCNARPPKRVELGQTEGSGATIPRHRRGANEHGLGATLETPLDINRLDRKFQSRVLDWLAEQSR